MFPSKLYDLQLTPSLNKLNCDLESAKLMESFKKLLNDDEKEILTPALVMLTFTILGLNESHITCLLWHYCVLEVFKRIMQR